MVVYFLDLMFMWFSSVSTPCLLWGQGAAQNPSEGLLMALWWIFKKVHFEKNWLSDLKKFSLNRDYLKTVLLTVSELIGIMAWKSFQSEYFMFCFILSWRCVSVFTCRMMNCFPVDGASIPSPLQSIFEKGWLRKPHHLQNSRRHILKKK